QSFFAFPVFFRILNQLAPQVEYAHSKPNIEKTPWGTIELTVIDPFSNRITLYEEKL
ncbi:glyoxalase superfamily protein, partial [Bacillus thuringiensis]|uniref:glyoxalase superfamily protein n=1 Tax=Bacillus thuringiensis TaxID=1428 RepID=UPI003000227E